MIPRTTFVFKSLNFIIFVIPIFSLIFGLQLFHIQVDVFAFGAIASITIFGYFFAYVCGR